MLSQDRGKEFKLPNLERSIREDAFDEIKLLSFPVSCSVFDLLQTKYRGDVMAKNLLQHDKKTSQNVSLSHFENTSSHAKRNDVFRHLD